MKKLAVILLAAAMLATLGACAVHERQELPVSGAENEKIDNLPVDETPASPEEAGDTPADGESDTDPADEPVQPVEPEAPENADPQPEETEPDSPALPGEEIADNIRALAAGTEYQIDLDGDGVVERVLYTANLQISDEDYYTMTLRINDRDYRTLFTVWPELIEDRFWLVDMDAEDEDLELVIGTQGPSDDPESQFFFYTENTLVSMGVTADLPGGTLAVDGQGMLAYSKRLSILQTWWALQPVVLSADHMLDEVRVEAYDTDCAVELLVPLSVVSDPDGTQTELLPGAGVIDKTDNISRCHVTMHDGTEGWFTVEQFSKIITGDGEPIEASDCFAGLLYAD